MNLTSLGSLLQEQKLFILKILIICLIICCLFSLQAVAAASDGNSTDSVVLTTDSNVSAYSLPNTDDQLRDGSDAGTFSDLQNDLSPGGDIVLTKNYTYDPLNHKNKNEPKKHLTGKSRDDYIKIEMQDNTDNNSFGLFVS